MIVVLSHCVSAVLINLSALKCLVNCMNLEQLAKRLRWLKRKKRYSIDESSKKFKVYSNRILIFLHSLEPGCCCNAILPLATFAKLLNALFLNLLLATRLFHSSLPICPSYVFIPLSQKVRCPLFCISLTWFHSPTGLGLETVASPAMSYNH